MKYHWILDNGHGIDTPGKRSPIWIDGSQLFEWEFNRDIVTRISDFLDKREIKYTVLVPEENDVTLPVRVKRANSIYINDRNSILISVHANAGGGEGWEIFTTKGETPSDRVATRFYNEFKKEFREERFRLDYSDADPDKEADFYVLKNTKMPAVLIENFFMDTESDCQKIADGSFRQRIANAVIKTILNFEE